MASDLRPLPDKGADDGTGQHVARPRDRHYGIDGLGRRGRRAGHVPGELWRGSSLRDLPRWTVRCRCVRTAGRGEPMKPVRRSLRSGGRATEVWENPDAPFECSVDEFERCVADCDWVRDWVLVFNMLTLSAGHLYVA